MFISFSVVDTYITPFLAFIMPIMESKMSVILLTLGIGSLIGSRLVGFLADRIGIVRTLIVSMSVQVLALVLLSTFSGWVVVAVLLLMIWGSPFVRKSTPWLTSSGRTTVQQAYEKGKTNLSTAVISQGGDPFRHRAAFELILLPKYILEVSMPS
ncbi:hypothetical protein [Paenibacillus caui]|uniref:hypothetical protein n=1 Tax=Paenibacillus caui TaxID=2873927 RepID=UPI00307FECAC